MAEDENNLGSRPSINLSGTNADFILGSENFPSLNGSDKPIENFGRKSGRQSFISCFKDPSATTSSSTIKLAFEEPRKDVDDFAFFSSGELQPHITSCESLIVGYFVGNRLDFNFVKENLTSLWKIKGDFSMAIHGEQAFIFKFSLEEDRTRVLELGSVHIASKLFLIRAWSPFLEQQVDSISSVPIWMILRDVPLHLWNEIGFSRITSLVGKPIMTDAPTALKTRMAFARVCVEIDANCTFPTKLPFQIDDKKYEVRAEYPWKPTSCCHCKSFGHSNDKCVANQVRKYSKKWMPKKTVTSSDARGTTLAGTSQEAEVRVENQIENVELRLNEKETVSEIVVTNSVEVTHLEKENEEIPSFQGEGEVTHLEKENEEIPSLQGETLPIEENWITYNSRNKNAMKRGDDKNKEKAVDCLNSFSMLEGNFEQGDQVEDECHAIVTDDIISSGDEMEIVHEKSLADIHIQTHKTTDQRVHKISALIGDPSGEQANLSIFSELNDKYQKSRKERELRKLGLKEEPNNDKLGRGYRKAAKKK